MPNEIRIDVDGQVFVMRLIPRGEEGADYKLSDDERADEL